MTTDGMRDPMRDPLSAWRYPDPMMDYDIARRINPSPREARETRENVAFAILLSALMAGAFFLAIVLYAWIVGWPH